MADWTWPTLLLVLGLGLIVAEVFLPAAGTLGVLAAVSLAGSCYVASIRASQFAYHWAGLELVAVSTTWFGTIYGLHRTPLRRLVYLEPPTMEELADPGTHLAAVVATGQTGRALTPLRPSGMIDIDGRRVEAMAESGLIAAGAAVIVVAVRSGRAVVRSE